MDSKTLPSRVLATLAVGALVLALMLAAAASAAPLSPSSPLYSPGGSPIVNENGEVTADYKGKLIENFEGARSDVKAELKWDESVSGPVDQIEYTAVYGARSIHWHINSLTGEVNSKESENGQTFSCKGTFSPTTTDGGTGGVLVPSETPGHPASGGDPATNADYTVVPPVGLPATLLSSNGPAGGFENCVTARWNSTLGDSGWGDAIAFASQEPAVSAAWVDTVYPTVYFPPGGGRSHPLPFSYTCTPPKCGTGSDLTGKTGLVTATVESSITFSSPGLGSGRPTSNKKSKPGSLPEGKPPNPVTCPRASKPTCQEKKLAQEDLRRLLPNLSNQCAITALGTGLVVAGLAAPESGVAVVLAAAGPTGAEIFALAAPTCGLLIKRAYDDGKIIEDPPIGHLDRLAQPAKLSVAANTFPACTPFAASVVGFCESLRADAARYLAAVQRTVAIDAALVTTVNRVTGAAQKHRASALRAQRRHASALRSQFSSAVARQRAAGLAIDKLVGSQGLELNLSAAQEQAGIADAFVTAPKPHLSRARFEHLTGLSVLAAPAEPLAELGR